MKKGIVIEIDHTTTVRGSLTLPENPTKETLPLVLLSTGYGGKGSKSKTWTALQEPLIENGIATAIFDFSGQGESSGKLWDLVPLSGVEQMHRVVIELKNTPGLDKTRFGILGSSFGGYVALIYAALYGEIKLLGLKSPVSDYAEVRELQLGQEGINRWRDKGMISIEDVESTYRFFVESKCIDIYGRLAPLINSECLIVHGDADTNVPIEQSKRLSSVLPNCYFEIVHGANHGYKEGNSFEVMVQLLVNWFVDRL